MENHDSQVVDDFCKYIIDHPFHVKVDSFDMQILFRFICNGKKHKKFTVPKLDVSGIEIADADKAEFKDLVKIINPFYNFKDSIKNQFYTLNYLLSKSLISRINKIKQTRMLPHSFAVYNPEKQIYMTFDELDAGSSSKEAVFSNLEEAESYVLKYIAVYQILGIAKLLEIHCINFDKQVIEIKKYGMICNEDND